VSGIDVGSSSPQPTRLADETRKRALKATVALRRVI